MAYVFGIDISSYDTASDWGAVFNQGVKFIFIKASENGFTDTRFVQNWQGAKSAGMLRGAYHFFHPEANSTQQAQVFIAAVGADKGELPPVLDLESVYINGKAIPLPAGNAMLVVIKDWLDRVEAAFGRKPIIYTSTTFVASQKINAPWLVNYPLWLAQYPYQPGTTNQYQNPQMAPTPSQNMPTQPAGFQPWTFWQYSSKGRLAGFPATQDMDFDYFNGSMDDLNKFAGTTSTTQPSGSTPPVATQYTVQPGDTLALIAQRLNVDLIQLTDLNNSTLIHPGQTLILPGQSGGSNSGMPSVAPTRTYTIKAGDNLTAIAAKFGVTVSAIVSANNLSNPNNISVGQVLKIP